ncbi:MAG: MBL fold metallo-hydrolase [Desulfatibacillum sp.]|nr:MBL fold metallo-hydrolase [Desulfatibacillum sp.]
MKKIILFAILCLLVLAVIGAIALRNAALKQAGAFDEKTWASLNASFDSQALYAPHEENGRFFAPWDRYREKRFRDVLGWKLSPKAKYTPEEESYLPKVVPDPMERIQNTRGDFIMWIGHNTFLIRIDNVCWLTDPIFSRRALLPARETPPGITLEDFINAAPNPRVIISHNHYDHLDAPSVKGLPQDTPVYVPLGLKKTVEAMGKTNVQEMDWWDEKTTPEGFRLVCLPAQHWSLRAGMARNGSLWASFMLIKDGLTIYMGGDSGYFPGYKTFGKAFPNIDYALLPTTAYHPRWFMHYQHMDAREALQAFDDLQARYFIPTQWGTFRLGDEPPGYPALDLQRRIAQQGRDSSRFLIPSIGQIIPINQ